MSMTEYDQQIHTDLRAQLETAKQKHREDIAAIGEALIDEATKRNWCNIYDEFIKNLNLVLHVELPTRLKEYTVRQSYTVVRTLVVEATDEDDASEKAEEAHWVSDLDRGEWTIEDVAFDQEDVEEN